MRRLLRQLWPVFSVLRSCALVAAGEAGLGRHCCTLNPSLSSAGAACRVPDSFLDRAEPESAPSVMASCTLTSVPTTCYDTKGQKGKRTKEDEKG